MPGSEGVRGRFDVVGGRRFWGVAVALGVLLGAVVATSARAEEPANPAAPGAALVKACTAAGLSSLPTIGPAACKGLDSIAVLLATTCERLPIPPVACSDLTDGRPIDPAAVTAFANGWVPRALRLQGLLDEDQPLRNEQIPHTHNSFNAAQYGPSLTTLDPNQRYTMTDQLRMGIRAIEMDVHWQPIPVGLPLADQLDHVVLCHGEVEHIGSLALHVGCSVDRPLGPGLDEVAAFLHRPGNEHEVVYLYLENQLDGDPAAHAATVALLQQRLGSLVQRPTGATPGTCQDLPMEETRAQLLAGGHRVILMGNCGPGAWSSWVYQRGPGWDEHGNSTPYPTFPACTADRAARGYDQHLIRVTEDSTFLSAITGSPAPITEPEVRAMVRCGVDWIGMDRIGPNDPRLADLVWSWAPNEPSAAGACGAWGTDARFRAAPCGGLRRVACRTTAGGWVASPDPVPWAQAAAACPAIGATFDVPRSGWQDEQLRAVGASIPAGLWLDVTAASGWRPA